ncbi:MAG: hypothetical protein KA342_04765 [Aminivibrio sp.]|nr:hypothetical protein [Aminivibrio sp.]
MTVLHRCSSHGTGCGDTKWLGIHSTAAMTGVFGTIAISRIFYKTKLIH